MNPKEATKLAINAGIDMSMVPYEYEQFINDLILLVEEGEVSMSRINDAVRKILKLKFELDLFNKPVTNYQDYPKFGSNESIKLAYESASESITLLKNNNSILPLKKDAKILITGPNANSMRTLNGAWTYNWQGKHTDMYIDGVPSSLINTAQKQGNFESKLIKDNMKPKPFNTIYEAFL